MTTAKRPEPEPWSDSAYLVLLLLLAMFTIRGCVGYVTDVVRIAGH